MWVNLPRECIPIYWCTVYSLMNCALVRWMDIVHIDHHANIFILYKLPKCKHFCKWFPPDPPEIKPGSSCTLETSGVRCLCIVESHPDSEIKLWGADPSSELRRTHEEKHSTLTMVTLQGALGISDTVHCQATNSQGNYTMTLQVPHNHETHSSEKHNFLTVFNNANVLYDI